MIVSFRYRWMVSALVAVLVTGNTMAQDDEVSGIGLGSGVRLLSSLGTQILYNDNRFRSNEFIESETGLQFDPELTLSYAPSESTYQLGYRGHIDPVVEDDYNDREFFLTADARPLLRHRFELDARYSYGHDELGLGRTQGAIDPDSLSLDEWAEQGINAQYTFGAPEARMNLSVRGGVKERDYKTNRDLGTRFLDYDSTLIGGTAAYRLGGKTQLVLDLEHRNFEYDVNANPAFDGTIDRALVGVRWIATAKTTGEILVGHYSRDFDESARADDDGADWQARIIWEPVTTSRFTLSTGRLIRETFLLGENFVNERFYKVDWRQDLNSRCYANLTATLIKTDFAGTPRSDDVTQTGVRLFYELTANTTVKTGVEFIRRDSSSSNFDYDRDALFLGFDFTY